MKPGTASVFATAEADAKAAGDAFVTTERLLIAIAKEGGEAAQGAEVRRRHARRPGRRRQGAAQGPHRRLRLRRGGLRRAEALRPRPHPGRARRKARPRHRPRRRDPPHHPGPLPPHQEQPRADRRARRRQDRHRRGPGAAHHQRRRAREPEGQEAAGPRHGRADRRREVPRRVRGAAEGRAERGHRRRGLDHPLHRRDAHPGRGREERGGDGRLQPAQARAGARRTTLRRRHHARRIPQARREGRGACAPLSAHLRQRADRRRHRLDPPWAEGKVRSSPRRAASPTRPSSRPRRCPTATSRTASCPTRRSTWSTRRRAACAWRSTPSRKSWTRSTGASCS